MSNILNSSDNTDGICFTCVHKDIKRASNTKTYYIQTLVTFLCFSCLSAIEEE